MATKTKSNARRSPRRRTSTKLICPECGFKAAHPMGLGRHRSARHGVQSKRELVRRSTAAAGRGGRREYTALARRLEELERRHDRLMKALLEAVKSGRRRG